VDNLAKCLMCDDFVSENSQQSPVHAQEISAFFVENLRGLAS
jgi:hypothetical protein